MTINIYNFKPMAMLVYDYLSVYDTHENAFQFYIPEPEIIITIQENGNHQRGIICIADFLAEWPTMKFRGVSLVCKNVTFFNGDTQFQNYSHYQSGIHSAEVSGSIGGTLECLVTDARGEYSKTLEIQPTSRSISKHSVINV